MRLHPQRRVRGGAGRDGQPEVDHPPAEDAQCGHAPGDAETDQQQRGYGVDNPQAARSQRKRAGHVGDAVGGEQFDRIGEVTERGDETPQRGGVKQPVERGPQQRPGKHALVLGQQGEGAGGVENGAFDALAAHARDLVPDGAQQPGGEPGAAGDAEHQGSDPRQHDGPDDGDRRVDRLESRQRNGDDKGEPQQHVQHHGGADPLGRHHHRGVIARDALGGEQPESERRCAQRPGRDHMRDRGGRQVDPEQRVQARLASRRQQHLGQHRVAEQRQPLEQHARGDPASVDPPEQVQVLARADEFGHHQVLDDQEQHEDEHSAPHRLCQQRQPG